MRPERIMDINMGVDGKGLYEKVQWRTKWVQYLENNMITASYTTKDCEDIFSWANNFCATDEQIHDLR